MLLDLEGAVTIRTLGGAIRAAEAGDLLYPGEVVAVPKPGGATLAILDEGRREGLRPGAQATVGEKGCSPPDAIAQARPQPPALASGLKGLTSSGGDGRKAGAAFRSDRGGMPQPITPIDGTTILGQRPSLAWPKTRATGPFRVFLSSSSGREVWRAEVAGSSLDYPAGAPGLEPGLGYRWEVQDARGDRVAAGEFRVATAASRARAEQLIRLAADGDRADRHAAAIGLRRLGALAQAIEVYERLEAESPDPRPIRRELAGLYRAAGRDPDGGRPPTGDAPKRR
jgi:hypothetical protein